MRIDLAVRTAKPTFIVRALAIVLAVTVLVGTGILLTKVAPAGQSENLLPLASSQGQSSTRTEASAPAQQALTSTQVTQTLTISPKKPTVGTEVRATASGLPAFLLLAMVSAPVSLLLSPCYGREPRALSESSELTSRSKPHRA